MTELAMQKALLFASFFFFGIFYFILLCTVASSESSFSLCLTVIVLMSVKFVSLSCVLCNLSCVQHLPHYFDHQLYKLHFLVMMMVVVVAV